MDLQEVMNLPRRPMTAQREKSRRDRRLALVLGLVGVGLLIGALGWLVQVGLDPAPGIWTLLASFCVLLAAGCFAVRVIMARLGAA